MSKDPADEPKPNVRNLHVQVDVDFHKRIRMLCVMQGITLKSFALTALREKVQRDEKKK